MRYDAKVDTNQPEIVQAFRTMGYTVHDTHRLGQGFPDLLVSGGRLGERNVLIEVKGDKGRLTADEKDFFTCWPGEKHVIRTIEEVERLHDTWLCTS